MILDINIYKSIFDSAPQGIVLHKNGKILSVNNKIVSKLHLDNQSHMIGKSLKDFFDQSKHSRIDKIINDLEDNTQKSIVEIFKINVNENILYFEATSRLIDSKSKIIISEILDKTIDYLQLKAMHKIEIQWNILINNLPLGLLIHDGKNIIFTNKTLKDMAFAKREDVVEGRQLIEIFPEFEKIIEQENLNQFQVHDAGFKFEFEHKFPDGEIGIFEIISKQFEINKKPNHLVLIKNITHEKEIIYNLKKFKIALDKVPFDMLIIDNEGFITFVNEALINHKNIDKANVIGINIHDFIEKFPSDSLLEQIEYAIRNKISTNCDFEYKRQNKSSLWYNLDVKPIRSENDMFDAFIVIVQDISESKLSQKRTIDFNKELQIKVEEKTKKIVENSLNMEHSQKAMIYLLEDMQLIQKDLQKVNCKLKTANSDLESFNFSVSHDLKAPLRAILNYSKFIKSDYYHLMNDEGKNMLDEVLNQSNYMDSMMDNLLQFSRYGRKKILKTLINMKELFYAVASETIKFRNEEKHFDIEIQNMPNILGDYGLIKQVVVNLLSNAVKFSSKEDKPQIKISSEENKNEVGFYVQDNGIGFSENDKDKMFELFNRLNNSKNFAGSGVGLALVKRIIENHGGRVIAESVNIKGSKIGFILPKN